MARAIWTAWNGTVKQHRVLVERPWFFIVAGWPFVIRKIDGWCDNPVDAANIVNRERAAGMHLRVPLDRRRTRSRRSGRTGRSSSRSRSATA